MNAAARPDIIVGMLLVVVGSGLLIKYRVVAKYVYESNKSQGFIAPERFHRFSVLCFALFCLYVGGREFVVSHPTDTPPPAIQTINTRPEPAGDTKTNKPLSILGYLANAGFVFLGISCLALARKINELYGWLCGKVGVAYPKGLGVLVFRFVGVWLMLFGLSRLLRG